MMKKLNKWQRVWLIVSALLLLMAVSHMRNIWPNQSDAVVSDLRNPDCQTWRELPEDHRLEEPPSPGEPCQALQAFMFYNGTVLNSVADYDQYLQSLKGKIVGWTLLIWLGVVVLIYAVGCSVGWALKTNRPQSG